MDFVTPRRSVALQVVSGRGHYDAVIEAVMAAETSVWVATANLKELMVEDHRARPGVRRRARGTRTYRSILAVLAELAQRGVELRILHAEVPSRPFRAELARQPALAAGALARKVCPRVHLKAVIVDGALLYLGSANWTGAGLGARGSGRRNFELGIVTDDGPLLDQVQGLYERIWRGAECGTCKLRAVCPSPLSDERTSATDAADPPARPRRRRGARRARGSAARRGTRDPRGRRRRRT